MSEKSDVRPFISPVIYALPGVEFKQMHKICDGQKLNFEAQKQSRKFWRKIKISPQK